MTEKNDSEIKKDMPDLPDSVVGLNGSVLPEDIENLNLEDESKPWNKQFEDDLDDSGNRSRVAKNKKKRGIKTLVFALFAALILLMCAPVVNWAMHSNSNPNSNGNGKIVANTDSNKSKNSDKKKSEKKDKKKKESEEKDSTEKESDSTETTSDQTDQQAAADAQAKADAEAKQKAAEQAAADAKAKKAAEEAEAAKKSSADSTGYYTVGAGDNPFRIAYNHNMTTDELYSLNGLQPGSVLKPGMRLRVK